MKFKSLDSCIETYLPMMKEDKQYTPIQRVIVLCHCINTYNGLTCIDQDNQPCEYPMDWRQHQANVYSIDYKFKDKWVQFRFVDCERTLSVNFIIQGIEPLQHIQLQIDCAQAKTIQAYQLELSNALNKKPINKEAQNRARQPLRTSPLFLEQVRPNSGPSMSRQQPLFNPLVQEEYVGRHNIGAFRNQGQQMPMVSPLARYDAVDPFDFNGNGPMFRNGPEFRGFDNLGRPIGGSNKGNSFRFS